jgi:hypothetical protein
MQAHDRHRSVTIHTCQWLTALGLAIGLGMTTAAQAQSSAADCPQAENMLQMAYPAAKPDTTHTGQASYLLGKQRLMLPGQGGNDAPVMFCKVWPAHDNLLLVAVPRMDAESRLDIDRMGDLDILVVDRKSLKVQQRMTVPDAMSDDAIRLASMSFDTARYVVAPNVQAFGLRASYHGSSRPNPFNQVTLRLFVMDDGGSGPLRMVLDGFSASNMHGDWDTDCKGQFSAYKTTLAMTDQAHHGFFDIRVTKNAQDSKADYVPNGSDCDETILKRQKTQHTLVYDGQQYVVPDALKDM